MTCPTCGNEGAGTGSICPYCGSAVAVDAGSQKTYRHKTVNLEAGRPTLEAALNRCQLALEEAITGKVRVLTLIHGYGSSGKGGVIRSECRKLLGFMKQKKVISDYIAGEDFHKKSGRVKTLLQRYPQLIRDRNLNQSNQGITLVILSCCALYCGIPAAETIFKATYLSQVL